jgi:RecG-like helicase
VNDNYLSMHFKSKLVAETVMANTISLYFTLNKDQEQVFQIVVNHSVSLGQLQLNMYLGGMAGTGKSQVIKVIVLWFVERQEEHQVMLMAPTGSAAALIGGSTYHSILRFTNNSEIGRDTSMKTLAKVSDQL